MQTFEGVYSRGTRLDMNSDKQQVRSIPQELSMEQVSDAKNRINELIWQYAPETITLKEADELAGCILNAIQTGRYTS